MLHSLDLAETILGPRGREESPARLRVLVESIAIYTLAWLALGALQSLSPGLSEPDVYYHIKSAWLLRTQGALDVFPWAATSMWREAYFNKDFGFHLLLVPFTFGGLVAGAKLAAVTLGAAVFASFYAILRLLGVRWAWLWTIALMAAGGYFGYRVNVARPHVVSVVLSLWAVYFVVRRSPLGVLATAFVYALSYTAPHVTIAYAAVGFTAESVYQRRLARPWVVLAALVGVLGGACVHPNFPHNFAGWWVQNVGVLRHAWGGDALPIVPPAELLPAATRPFLVEHAVIYIGALSVVVLLPRVRDRLEPGLVTVALLANVSFGMACLSKRFVEYFVPFSLLCIALVWSRGFPAWTALSRRQRAATALVLAAVLLTCGVHTIKENVRTFASVKSSNAAVVGQWLYDNVPHDELVFTCDWDDAPELFFFNHRNRYPVFLDPMYMAAWRPALYRTWRLVAEGVDPDPVETIRHGFGARAGFCTADFRALHERLRSDGRVRVSELPGGYVFMIEDETKPPADAGGHEASSPPRDGGLDRAREQSKRECAPGGLCGQAQPPAQRGSK